MPYDLAMKQLPRAHLISEEFNQRTIKCDTFQYMIEGIVSLETYCHELAHMLHNISTHSASLDNVLITSGPPPLSLLCKGRRLCVFQISSLLP